MLLYEFLLLLLIPLKGLVSVAELLELGYLLTGRAGYCFLECFLCLLCFLLLSDKLIQCGDCPGNDNAQPQRECSHHTLSVHLTYLESDREPLDRTGVECCHSSERLHSKSTRGRYRLMHLLKPDGDSKEALHLGLYTLVLLALTVD